MDTCMQICSGPLFIRFHFGNPFVTLGFYRVLLSNLLSKTWNPNSELSVVAGPFFLLEITETPLATSVVSMSEQRHQVKEATVLPRRSWWTEQKTHCQQLTSGTIKKEGCGISMQLASINRDAKRGIVEKTKKGRMWLSSWLHYLHTHRA